MPETPDDYLLMALVLYEGARLAEAAALLRSGLEKFPGEPALHENLAVARMGLGDPAGAISSCESALAAGSDSPNVWDCLSDAHARLGRLDLAVAAGRTALTIKDRFFGNGIKPLTATPPPFNPHNPAENVIAYCLWGNDPRYQMPLLENARLLPHLFPEWTMRVYHEIPMDPALHAALSDLDVDLRPATLPGDMPAQRRKLWRFDVMADPAVRRFLVRDADSLLTVKERVAIDAWLASDRCFHAMRDWYTHTDLLLAGLWGGVGGILPSLDALIGDFRGWRAETSHIDQDLLSEMVWPLVRSSILIHDSIFTGCLGSVPFPPFGSLPPGQHIGQNAFPRFARAG